MHGADHGGTPSPARYYQLSARAAKLRRMIVAITGANGFIGQHLCERFAERGDVVRPIIRRDLDSPSIGETFDGVDVVVHAAGATRAPSREVLRASNVELTRRVVDLARRSKVARFVFVSSQAAAGPASFLDAPVTEDMSPAPIEAYGRSKLDAEQVVRTAEAVPWVIARPAAVYGPRDRDFLALFRLARRGVAIHGANRAQWISIIHVRDVADGIVRAATVSGALGGTFFLANEAPVQWAEVFRSAARVARRRLIVDVEIPGWLVEAGAAAGDVLARVAGSAGLLTSEKVALTKPRFWICSSEHAKRELGFVPRIGLQEGLTETHDWYRTQGWL
jgi:nucleoside-diphosphate-sugar epimerase